VDLLLIDGVNPNAGDNNNWTLLLWSA